MRVYTGFAAVAAAPGEPILGGSARKKSLSLPPTVYTMVTGSRQVHGRIVSCWTHTAKLPVACHMFGGYSCVDAERTPVQLHQFVHEN